MATEAVDLRLKQWQRGFISACHILHHHRVLDAYGHLSVRHPDSLDRVIMCRNLAPGTVSSRRDLVEYYVETAGPIDPNAPEGYVERYIHSEVYKRFKNVNAVIHSHSEAVVPYTVSGVPMKPCFHMGGFLGAECPVYDIARYYEPDDRRDMLVRNKRLGEELAKHFGEVDTPHHSVVLMRGHGFTVLGIQTTTLLTRAAYSGPGSSTLPPVQYLSQEETEGTIEITKSSVHRPWGLWLREVEAQGMYVNMA